MKTLVLVLVGGILIGAVAGCEMTKGAGQDLENTGKNIKETVEKNQ